MTTATSTKVTTREAWLEAAIEHFRPWFDDAGTPLPETVRVSVGWSKRPGRGIGWCYAASASDHGHPNVFVSPELDDVTGKGGVLATLLHELVHAADDCQSGHRGRFRTLALALGLTGKMTSTTASEELLPKLKDIAEALGDYPHGRMNTGRPSDTPKKQGTRMLKLLCTNCGYKARTTKKWLEMGLPTCPCGTEMEAP